MEITLIQTYKELNHEIRSQIKEIDDQIDELYERKCKLAEIMTNNVDNITKLEGYECILSSTDIAVSDVSESYQYGGHVEEHGKPLGSNQSTDTDTLLSKKSKRIKISDKDKPPKERKQTKAQRKTKVKYYTDNPYILK